MSEHAAKEEQRQAITVEEALGGAWIEPAVSYVDPVRRFCAMTGRPIARRYWRVASEGTELTFCDPAEAVRYATYPYSSERAEEASSK